MFFAAQTSALKVDRAARRINGLAIATKGDANGDTFDDETLKLLATLGATSTVRARFDHPNRARSDEIEQTLRNLLGQHVNFRVDGDVVRADCQLAGVNLDLEDTILALAEKTPHLFGVSVVFDETPLPKGQKAQRGAPCRPAILYAADFVDIPASNGAGLFAAKTAESTPMDLDMYAKDGKLFCQVDGKEYALKHNTETFAATKAAMKAAKETDDDDPESEAAKKKAATLQTQTEERKPVAETTPDIEKVKADAIAAERARRKTFGTILSTAGVTQKEDLEELEAFYEQGMDEKQLKFLASRTIGARAKAVGEGSGNPEPKPGEKQPGKDPAAAAESEAGKRFDEEPSLRRSYSVTSNDPSSEQWKTARGRHVAAARRRFLAEPK